MTTNFMNKAAIIFAEIRNQTCIDEEVIKKILQDALNELNAYYEEEYYNALNTARNSAYDEGFDDGYDVGYDVGYDEGHSAV